MSNFPYGMPCMRCGIVPWEVVYDDSVMEYALCKKCCKIMKESDKSLSFAPSSRN